MFTLSSFLKKAFLAALVLAIGAAAILPAGASAAALNDDPIPPAAKADNIRLENTWARLQAIYQREGNRLAMADEFIAKVQALIDRANQKGWDTSLVQEALNAFASVIPAAQAAHDRGEAIIANHEGFNPVGKVIDRAEAINTVRSLAQVLKDTRAAMNGTGRALREAIRDFRQAHQPAAAPATTTP